VSSEDANVPSLAISKSQAGVFIMTGKWERMSKSTMERGHRENGDSVVTRGSGLCLGGTGAPRKISLKQHLARGGVGPSIIGA